MSRFTNDVDTIEALNGSFTMLIRVHHHRNLIMLVVLDGGCP